MRQLKPNKQTLKFPKRVIHTNGMDRTSSARWRRIWKHLLPQGGKGARLLDAGCGEHIWSASDYPTIVRADNWQVYKNRKGKKTPKGIVDVDLCQEPWPWKKNEFDGVISVDVIEHVENIWAFFRQAFRVARRFVIVATPNPHSPLSIAMFADHGRFWAFTPGEITYSKHLAPVFDWQFEEAARRAGWRVSNRAYTDEKFANPKYILPHLREIAAQRPTQRSAVIKMVPGR